MLVENGGGTAPFKSGDPVKIMGTVMAGKLMDFVNGQWRVAVPNVGTIMCEETQLERQTVLLG